MIVTAVGCVNEGTRKQLCYCSGGHNSWDVMLDQFPQEQDELF